LTTYEANGTVYGIVDETPTDIISGGFVEVLGHFDSVLCSGILEDTGLYVVSKWLFPRLLTVRVSASSEWEG
jgi:hypothetical protein